MIAKDQRDIICPDHWRESILVIGAENLRAVRQYEQIFFAACKDERAVPGKKSEISGVEACSTGRSETLFCCKCQIPLHHAGCCHRNLAVCFYADINIRARIQFVRLGQLLGDSQAAGCLSEPVTDIYFSA